MNRSSNLIASSISKNYGAQRILEGISLEVAPSETLAICGPSGSGKSTFLRILAGLETADSGTVRLGETPVDRKALRRPSLRGKIGFVFQRPGLYPHMCALENVALALRQTLRLSRREANQRAEQALQKVGVVDKTRSFPAQLSGGQQQRVSIARTLALEPHVLLLDEPTSALDPERIREVLDVLRALAGEGTTMAVVTHELAFAREIAGRVGFIDEGRLLELSPSREFFAEPRTERARTFINHVLHH